MSTVGPILLIAGAIVLVISLGRLARGRGRGASRSDGDEDAEAVRRVREATRRHIAGRKAWFVRVARVPAIECDVGLGSHRGHRSCQQEPAATFEAVNGLLQG